MDWSRLNDGQKKAVKTLDGYIKCTASAGSGKTFALTHRVAYMLELGIDPEGILCFTFTKKAAEEMQARLLGLVGSRAEPITIGTMHSVFYRILRTDGPRTGCFRDNLSVVTGWKQQKLYEQAFEEAVSREENMAVNPTVAAMAIGRAKNDLLGPEAYRAYLVENAWTERYWIADVYRQYEYLKSRENAIDFDDMLYKTWKMMAEHPQVALTWSRVWPYILVDEFQDTNTAQMELIKFLTQTHNNLFIVGDEKQAIYGFRAARVEYIQNFHNTFQGSKSIELDVTYRCRERIIGAANKLAEKMDCGPARAVKSGGEVEVLGHFDEAEEEAEVVASTLQGLIRKGTNPREVKILYRTNAQSRALEEELLNRRIPHVVLGGLSFFKRREVQDMIAYLKIVHRPETALDGYERIYNKPNRFLGKAFFRDFTAHSQRGTQCLQALLLDYPRSYMQENAGKFHQELTTIMARAKACNHVGDIIEVIREETAYDPWFLDSKAAEPDESGDSVLFDNLKELVQLGRRFKKIGEFLDYVRVMQDMSKEKKVDAVQLMTIHKAKGLEAKVVFVVGFSKGLLPHARSSDFAEERRMAYVAVTRAEDRLYLSSFAHRFNGVMEPSPFLFEMEVLQDQEVEQVEGDEVVAVPFEPGTVQARVLEKEVVNE